MWRHAICLTPRRVPRASIVLSATMRSEVFVMAGSVFSHKLPSVDPEVEQAAADIVRDPDVYFERQRALRAREAEEYVERKLATSRRRRSSRLTIPRFLARLSRG
jgi:hypothetical protein